MVVGDEILAGHTQDTNSHWLAKALFQLGAELEEVRAVADEPAAIQMAVYELQERRDATLVFVCGGLGPTHDDRTVATMARFHSVPLVIDQGTWERLDAHHKRLVAEGKRDREGMSEGTRKMTLVPKGAEVFTNAAGAAPGLALRRRTLARDETVWTVVLPGVPQELRTLWGDHVEGFVRKRLGPDAKRRHTVEMRYEGFESEVADEVTAVADDHDEVLVGSYPRWGEGEVVLRVSGADEEKVEEAARDLEGRVARSGARLERATPSKGASSGADETPNA